MLEYIYTVYILRLGQVPELCKSCSLSR